MQPLTAGPSDLPHKFLSRNQSDTPKIFYSISYPLRFFHVTLEAGKGYNHVVHGQREEKQ